MTENTHSTTLFIVFCHCYLNYKNYRKNSGNESIFLLNDQGAMLVYSRILIKLYPKMYILHKRDILQSITFLWVLWQTKLVPVFKTVVAETV